MLSYASNAYLFTVRFSETFLDNLDKLQNLSLSKSSPQCHFWSLLLRLIQIETFRNELCAQAFLDMFCCMVCWDLPALSLSCKIMSSDLQDLEDELAYDETSSCIEVGSPS